MLFCFTDRTRLVIDTFRRIKIPFVEFRCELRAGSTSVDINVVQCNDNLQRMTKNISQFHVQFSLFSSVLAPFECVCVWIWWTVLNVWNVCVPGTLSNITFMLMVHANRQIDCNPLSGINWILKRDEKDGGWNYKQKKEEEETGGGICGSSNGQTQATHIHIACDRRLFFPFSFIILCICRHFGYAPDGPATAYNLLHNLITVIRYSIKSTKDV